VIIKSLGLAALALCSSFAWASEDLAPMTIIYGGNTDGELEPCGCSMEGNQGGILRRATTIDGLRAGVPDLFLVDTGGVIVSLSPHDKLTSEYILKGIAKLDYDAIGMQWSDLSYGEGFIQQASLPWVVSNWHSPDYSAMKLIKKGGYSLAVFSWLDPEKSPTAQMQGQHKTVTDDMAALTASLKQARAEGALTMVMTTFSIEQIQQKLPLSLIDIVTQKSSYEVFGEPQMLGSTLVIQPGSRGMRIGRLDLELDNNGRIASYQHKVMGMPPAIEDSERMLDWYKTYNAQVKENYLKRVAQRKANRLGQSPYVGEEACKSCHQAQHKTWKDTLHEGAYYKLEDVNKSFDPNCIGCHTVGYEQPGGFIDMDTSSHLLGVQCENCHGAGREHVDSQGSKASANHGWQPEQMCAQCHVQKHSPSFKFEKYWPRIKH